MKIKLKILLSLFVVMAFLFTACEPAGTTDNDAGPTSVENAYAKTGPHRTASKSGDGFQVFYPRDLENDSYPILMWANGIGTPTIAYTPLLTHLASWGFVVVASNSSMDWNGRTLIKGIDYIIEQNETSGSPFFGKLDTSRIGATGHSLGGGAACNAATDARVSCSAPMAPAPLCTPGQVKGPILLISGSMDTIIFPSSVKGLYNTVVRNGEVPAMYAENKSMGHIAFAWYGGGARGYLTAWFMYQLQNDPVAAQAFTDGCEICNNAKWKVENNFDSF